MELAKVHDLYVLMQAIFKLLNESHIAGRDDAVIHIYCNDYNFLFVFVCLVEHCLVD